MPEPLWIDRRAWLYLTPVTPCSAIADALDSVSHARLTRMLQGPWSGHTLRALAWRPLFPVAAGSLSVADPVIATPSARLLGEAAWVWSHKDRTGLLGVSVVLLVWPEGPSRMPLACRVGPSGGASKYAVALELRSSARTRLTCQPALVLLDSWSPSQQLLKRSRDSGWSVGCQRQQNRRCAGRALRDSRQPPDGHAVGARTGGSQSLW